MDKGKAIMVDDKEAQAGKGKGNVTVVEVNQNGAGGGSGGGGATTGSNSLGPLQGNDQAVLVANPNGAVAGSVGAPSSRLNPAAREWNLAVEQSPEARRSLFMTFSNGFPLTRDSICDYFTQRYGGCVKDVYVHQQPAVFGRVVFHSACMPTFILQNKEVVRIWIDGRPIWLKRFRDRNEDA